MGETPLNQIAEFLAEELPCHAPFWEQSVTFSILWRGFFLSTNTMSGKRKLLAEALLERIPEALLERIPVLGVAAWHGKYRTDQFIVSQERMRKELVRPTG